MHTNELSALKPGAGLLLATIPETKAAAENIGAAYTTLAADRDALHRKVIEARRVAALGVDVPGMEVAAWRSFQAGALRTFHNIRAAAAADAIRACEAASTADADEVRKREKGIAAGLGKLMGDERAGADVSLLLLRLTGGLPLNEILRDVCNRWRNVAETSRRALHELPLPMEPKPSADANAAALQELLTTKEG